VFGPNSQIWRIDREAAAFLGAGRALLMQLGSEMMRHRGSHRVTPRKRGHVDHWQSAVPPSLSEASHAPCTRCRTGFPSLQHFTKEINDRG